MKLQEKIKIVLDINKQFGLKFALQYAFYLKTYQYEKYIDFVSEYLKEFFEDDIRKFNQEKRAYVQLHQQRVENVFVCWWQGYDNMPTLCKACYKRLKSVLSDEYNLIFITKDNYKDYVEIPYYIIQKLEAGLIPVTQFSDVLRQGLIAQNGGIWIDSTIWVNEGINDCIKNIDEFWSVKLKEIYNKSVIGQLISGCNWSSFIVGGCKGSPVFRLMFSCMCKYYKEHDTPIDYYLQNLLYKLIFDQTEYCKMVLERLNPSNPHLYDLKNVFNHAFDEAKFAEYNADTSVFKLTYKAKYNEMCEGRMTYYNYIINSLSEGDN